MAAQSAPSNYGYEFWKQIVQIMKGRQAGSMLIGRGVRAIIILLPILERWWGPGAVIPAPLRGWAPATLRATTPPALVIPIPIPVTLIPVALPFTFPGTLPFTVAVAVTSVPATPAARAAGTFAVTTRGRPPVIAPYGRRGVLRPL